MKITEIIRESMDFDACTYDPVKNMIKTLGSMQDEECYACDGSGKDVWDDTDDCRTCDGEGSINIFKSDGPTLNVSNSNGYEIQRMLGIDPDYSGIIMQKDFPEYKRKLMKILNSGKSVSQHTKDVDQTGGEMGKTGQSGNVTNIGKTGPTMIDMGRTSTQVQRYASELLKIINYAENNGGDCISWG